MGSIFTLVIGVAACFIVGYFVLTIFFKRSVFLQVGVLWAITPAVGYHHAQYAFQLLS